MMWHGIPQDVRGCSKRNYTIKIPPYLLQEAPGADSMMSLSMLRRTGKIAGSLVLPALVVVALCFSFVCSAAEIDELEAAIVAWNKSRLCPAPNEFEILKFSTYCKRYCDLGFT